jgi:hypothetical protein
VRGVRPPPRQTEHRAASGIRSLWPEVFGMKTPYLQSTVFLSRLPVPVVQPHCTENSKHIFPERKLRGLVPNVYIHVSVSNLFSFLGIHKSGQDFYIGFSLALYLQYRLTYDNGKIKLNTLLER